MQPELPISESRSELDAVLADVMRRIGAGEPVDEESLIAAHPELGDELRDYFSHAGAIDRVAAGVTTRNASAGTPSSALEVRCPNCHAPMEVAVDTALTDLTCPCCGSHFSLINQSKTTWMAPSLTRLGRFELVERVGVGGFGSVWKARDKELDRTVAIKIPRAGGMTGEEQEKFFREARAAAQLRHPNIVSVHEVGRDGDSVYIVSDFVRGVTLGDWLTGQQLTSREAAELCAKIADALHHAHEQGVVHRDLKPANIMIDSHGQPHLMDFGLARREVGEVTVTLDGQVLGTPAYMSPEQAQGEAHKADRRSDIYSLGVILFQLLTGELPFRGNARMIMHQVINDEPPSPRKLNANVGKDLETITLKCLEKDSNRRYQTAHELALDLRRHISGEPIIAGPISGWERAWRWAKRKPMMATTAFLLLVLGIAGPIAALREQRLRRLLEVRFVERDKLISQKDREMQRAAQTIRELSSKLDNWEGKANPSELWTPLRDESPRRMVLRDAFERINAPLLERLQNEKIASREAACGYLGLAMMADAIGRQADAIRFYKSAIYPLQNLKQKHPNQLGISRALAECYTSLATLVGDEDRAAATDYLTQARLIYQELTHAHEENLELQIASLESELNSAKLAGRAAAGQAHLERISELNGLLMNKWPGDPVATYELACFLMEREPLLISPISEASR
jgi:hypothetical protein